MASYPDLISTVYPEIPYVMPVQYPTLNRGFRCEANGVFYSLNLGQPGNARFLHSA